MDLVTFTEEILNGKLHFLCSVNRAWINWAPNYKTTKACLAEFLFSKVPDFHHFQLNTSK